MSTHDRVIEMTTPHPDTVRTERTESLMNENTDVLVRQAEDIMGDDTLNNVSLDM